MVILRGGAEAATALGWDTPVKFGARMAAVGLAVGLALAGVGVFLSSAAITAIGLLGVFSLGLLVALIVVPARLYRETHPDDDDHEINLVFEPADEQFFHMFGGNKHAHVVAYNKTRKSIPDVAILVGVPQFSLDNTSFSRVPHIRAGNVPLAWCHLPTSDPSKHKPALLPPGESLIDIFVAETNFIRLEVETRHGGFRMFTEQGFYRLRIRAASPDASSAALDILIEWRGDPNTVKVSRLSPSRSRERPDP